MKPLKFILILILISSLSLPAMAEKRRAKKSMKELTDPNSPSYVPFPYPKTRQEILADLKFYYMDLTANAQSAFVGGVPMSERIPQNLFKKHKRSEYKTKESRKKILTDIFNPDTKYRIGKIIKVKNCMEYIPDDYYWLIHVMDKDGDAVMRMSLLASGLGWNGSAIDKNRFVNASAAVKANVKRNLKVISKEEIKQIFAAALGDIVADSKIVKIERLGFSGRIGSFTVPVWNVKVQGGESYYYSERTNSVYKVSEKIQWKKVNGFFRHPRPNRKNPHQYIPDRINDKFIILEHVPRIKQ